MIFSSLTAQRGSSIIELLIILQLTFYVLTGTLVLTYICFAKLTLQNVLHETLICSVREERVNFCKNSAKRALKKILFFGQLKKIEVRSLPKHLTGEIEWKFEGPFGKSALRHNHKVLNDLIVPSRRTKRGLLW